jgi:glycosyltransferase involved in cell wall biosynthesis
MNVLQINQSYEIRGGAEVYVHQLQDLLPHYNVSSFFVAVSEPDRANRFSISGKDISLTHQSEKEVEQFLTSYMQDNKVDIIHIHSVSNKNLVKFCLDKKPVIRSMHEPRMFCPGRQKFFLKSETICQKPFGLHCCVHAYTQKCQDSRIPAEVIKSYSNVKFEINYASKRYKRIVAMSDYIKKEAVLAGIPEQSIIVNPYFTPIVDVFNEEVYKKETTKHIVFVGRLHPSKGAHTLIRSLRNILKSQNNVVLNVIGDGLFKNELLNFISLEDIPSEKIIFHGWLSHNDTMQKIKEAYLVVFPSIYPEAFGIVGIEAMMYAKPVVAFDAGGISTWLQNNITGFSVEVKDENKFEEKVNALLHNEGLHREFSLNAKKSAMKKFVPEIHLNTLVELYNGAVNN